MESVIKPYQTRLKSNKKFDFLISFQESTQTAGEVVFHVFDPVIVQLSIDRSNVQHMKLSLKLVKPKVQSQYVFRLFIV